MYDTINLWLPYDCMGWVNTSAIEQSLEHLTIQEKEESISVSGLLNGVYQVRLSEQGIRLNGSLAKFFLSDNFNTLTRADTKRAIEKLSDELKVPISKAKVRRIDFSTNFLMKYSPEAYYNHLGESQYYLRTPFGKSLYYSNKQRKKLFYNKVAEGKKKGYTIPQVWEGKNVLRYELRYTSRIKEQLKENEILADKLFSESFYQKMVNNWFKEYELIDKINKFNMNITEINTPKDFLKLLQVAAIGIIGQDEVINKIEELRKIGVFEKPEYYSRLKSNIKDLSNLSSITEESELIRELNKKIKNTTKYSR